MFPIRAASVFVPSAILAAAVAASDLLVRLLALRLSGGLRA
jgi:hypothetical protein